MLFNGSIRFCMEIFFDVLLIASLNLHTIEWDSPFIAVQVSNYLSIALLALICLWPFCTLLVTCIQPVIWANQRFRERCGEIVFKDASEEKWARKERSLLVLPVMFYVRRVAFTITVILFRYNIWAQLAVQTFLALWISIYLQWYRPFDDQANSLNRLETFNEVTLMVLTYYLYCFTGFGPDPYVKNELGFAYNATSMLSIATHLFIMVRGNFMSIRLTCKKRKYAKMVKEAQEKRR